jgi:hypothetical protein
MNTRVFTLVSSAVALALVAGCTAVYKNAATCEDTMRSAANEQAASQTLTITHRGAAIHGSRVVVEGAFESMVPASSVAAITTAWATAPASGPSEAADADANASEPAAASAASAVSVQPGTGTASQIPVPPSTSAGMAGILAPSFASAPGETGAVKPKAATRVATKPVKLAIPAAMECRFDGLSLTSFHWLAPGKLVSHADADADAGHASE